MPTQKQINANRRNAQKSTGPRTENGKSISRLNARRDGFTGQIVILDAEYRPHFEKFKSNLIADLQPKTTLALSLAHSIAWDTWRERRLHPAFAWGFTVVALSWPLRLWLSGTGAWQSFAAWLGVPG